MRLLTSAIFLMLLAQLSYTSTARAADLTGTWESKYQFGPIEEVMTANVQQVGEDLLGSFTVQPASGDKYSGIIFGTVDGDRVKAYYLTEGSTGGRDSHLSITFADCSIIDSNTLKGTYYVQDSDMNATTGPFEAIKK